MKSLISKTLSMAFCYGLAATMIFAITNGVSPATQRLGEMAFIVFPLSFLFFWVGMLPASVAWIKLRSNLLASIAVSVAVLLVWSYLMSLTTSFQVKPGYFGRAIEDGAPTIHFFIDYIMEFVFMIIIFEIISYISSVRSRKGMSD